MIPFTDYGGEGKYIHFLHANGYPPACYLPLIECLKKHYRVSAMHLRPLWPGSQPKEIRAWHPLSDDFILYLKSQQDPPFIAVGHSLGAIVAMRAAIYQPEMFKALILIDPVLFSRTYIATWNVARAIGLGDRLHPLIPGALKRRRHFEDPERIFNSYRRKPIFRYFSDFALRSYIYGILKPSENHGFDLAYSPEWEAQIYSSGIWKDMDIWRNLPGMKLAKLIIRGKETDTFLAPVANQVQRLSPSTRIKVIENSTHLVPMEKPQETCQAIHEFIQEIT